MGSGGGHRSPLAQVGHVSSSLPSKVARFSDNQQLPLFRALHFRKHLPLSLGRCPPLHTSVPPLDSGGHKATPRHLPPGVWAVRG